MASQSQVYPIRDAILAVNHASCPSLTPWARRCSTRHRPCRARQALDALAGGWGVAGRAGVLRDRVAVDGSRELVEH